MVLMVTVAWICLPIASAWAQGNVRLNNISAPYTHIEAGNYVEIRISGAAPNGTVTLTQRFNSVHSKARWCGSITSGPEPRI